MRGLAVVDLVAIACEMWECEPDKALERLDLGALEQAIEAAFPGGEVDADADVGVTSDPVDAVATAAAHLVRGLLTTEAAGRDTRYFTLVALTCLATATDRRLSATGEEMSLIFLRATSLRYPPRLLARWLSRHLVAIDDADLDDEETVDDDELDGEVLSDEIDDTDGSPYWPDLGCISSHLRQALLLAPHESRRLGQAVIGTEHLLLGLLAVTGSHAALACEVSGLHQGRIRYEVLRRLGQGPTTGDRGRALTEPARAALEVARQEADADGSEAVTTHHVLLALMQDPSNLAAQVLFGALREETVRYGLWLSETPTVPTEAGPLPRPPLQIYERERPRPTIRTGTREGRVAAVIRSLVPGVDLHTIVIQQTERRLVVTVCTRHQERVIGPLGVTARKIRQALGDRFGVADVALDVHPPPHSRHACGFCHRGVENGVRLVLGGHQAICEPCVDQAAEAIRYADRPPRYPPR